MYSGKNSVLEEQWGSAGRHTQALLPPVLLTSDMSNGFTFPLYEEEDGSNLTKLL